MTSIYKCKIEDVKVTGTIRHKCNRCPRKQANLIRVTFRPTKNVRPSYLRMHSSVDRLVCDACWAFISNGKCFNVFGQEVSHV